MKATIRNFLQMESAGGLVLMGGAALALVAANSPLADYYDLFIDSLASGVLGYIVLDCTLPKAAK
jgi:Na+/H+ antiporter NhaA